MSTLAAGWQAVWGDERRVSEDLRGLLSLGVAEILASPLPAGGDRAASLEHTLGGLAQSVTE